MNRGGISEVGIQRLFAGGTKIPSLPEIFYQFKKVIDDPESSFQEIGNVISKDPGLTVRLLKIVNSPFFGFPSRIETVSHAIGIIGRNQLNDLVLSTVVIDRFKGIPVQSINMKTFWKHSVACGLAASLLAARMRAANPERFFVAGLLHDIGHVAICMKLPVKVLEVSLRARLKSEPLCKVEEEVMGFNHAEVGGHLLKTWKLPESLAESVAFHHDPGKAPQYSLDATVVHAADVIANRFNMGFSAEIDIGESTLEASVLERIQIPEKILFSAIGEQMQQRLEETSRVFLQVA